MLFISPSMELAYIVKNLHQKLSFKDWSRSLSSATGVKVELSRVYRCFVFLLPICITLHLLVFKEICNCADHKNRLSKSFCHLTCSWCLKHVKSLVSSAKSLTIHSTILGRSLINIRNKAGPKNAALGRATSNIGPC